MSFFGKILEKLGFKTAKAEPAPAPKATPPGIAPTPAAPPPPPPVGTRSAKLHIERLRAQRGQARGQALVLRRNQDEVVRRAQLDVLACRPGGPVGT